MNFVENKLQDNNRYTFIDIGANVGFTSREVFLNNTNIDQIICIEPVKSTFSCLEKNTSTFQKRLLFNFALGQNNSTEEIYIDNANNGNASLVESMMDTSKYKSYETEKIAKSKKNNDNVYVVPAFSGMGAPYWRPDARGVITGLTRDSDWKSIVRATVESVGYQSFDLFDSMNKDGLKPRIVKVDGGMVANNWFTQFLADIINLKVVRPKILETTALGVALLSGYQIGEYKSLNQIKDMWKKDRIFKPKMKQNFRKDLLNGWKLAIKKTLA